MCSDRNKYKLLVYLDDDLLSPVNKRKLTARKSTSRERNESSDVHVVVYTISLWENIVKYAVREKKSKAGGMEPWTAINTHSKDNIANFLTIFETTSNTSENDALDVELEHQSCRLQEHKSFEVSIILFIYETIRTVVAANTVPTPADANTTVFPSYVPE